MNDARGSIWRKWDLHVHTPYSIEQNYGGEGGWDDFVLDLENLPPEFKVLGINDYIFLDGYEKLKALKDRGRLQNIDLLLPVVELRIDRLAGTEGHLSRLNYHIIFSDEVSAETIKHQFIAGLVTHYQLSPEYEELKHRWQSIPTRDSIADLGILITESTPLEKRGQLGGPLAVGFRNLNFNLDRIESLLQNPLFEHKHLVAVGKAEWDQMRWDKSAAEKKTIINKADLVFTAAESLSRWRGAKTALASAGVNDRLLDCSDAHYFSGAAHKDRIGNCFTWIKADTTFTGLRQALNEPGERICVADEPAQLRRVRDNKTKYICSISIRKEASSRFAESWFDFTLPLNHGLVAIIGNKGMGKSALADTIALLGESGTRHFSFLNAKHFRHPRNNKAKHFFGTLVWESGKEVAHTLDTESQGAAMMVRYVPQNLFEDICNELPVSGESAFNRELSDVIFSHVRPEDRRGFGTLGELLRARTEAAQADLSALRLQLKAKNSTIARLEEETSAETRRALSQHLEAKQEELRVHDAARPVDQAAPKMDDLVLRSVQESREALDQVEAGIREALEQLGKLRADAAALRSAEARIDRFERQAQELLAELSQELAAFDLDVQSLVQVTIEKDQMKALELELREGISRLEARLSTEGLMGEKASLESGIAEQQASLEGPMREYQRHVDEVRAWSAKRVVIQGDESQAGTLRFLEIRLARLEKEALEELEKEQLARDVIVRNILSQLEELAVAYRQLYQPVQSFLDAHDWVRRELKLEFGVSLEADGFEDELLGFIHKGRRGPFYGAEEGRKKLEKLVRRVDFNEADQVLDLLHQILNLLGGADGGVAGQLREKAEASAFYDFLFSLSYLAPRYTLNVGGRSIEGLSPGERGMLLLVFYLLVDRGDVPLIVDQPEENLDNQSVYSLLVPCVKEVRKRRQIILVTHNPNLAVVCDAEQIIHAYIDKGGDNRVVYTAGAIENPIINKRIVDVLEGTWPAFKNRAAKYDLFPAGVVLLPVFDVKPAKLRSSEDLTTE